MIKLPNARLSSATNAQLKDWQREVNQAGDYVARVAAAKTLFVKRAGRDLAEVRRVLARMCVGPRRCGYCEDSVADEIEHFKPKDLYPELVFAWFNYLFACGGCNRGKNKRFAVFMPAGEFRVITRPRNAPVVPPEKGKPVLIDPRREDAMQWIQLDLRNTFEFAPRILRGTPEYIRAAYTIEVLKLNDRDELRRARKSAYQNYRARLVEYIKHKDDGASLTKLKSLRKGLQRESHPTVWAEMKRQHPDIPELKRLFAKAHEALDW